MMSTPVRSPAACSASQLPQLAGLESRRIEVEATFWHDLVFVGQRLEQPIAQHPKLQAIEQLVSRLTVPGAAYQIVEAERQVEITYQGIHLPVAQHIVDPLLERLGRLALELARMCGKISSPSYISSHLAAVLGPTPGTPGRLSLDSPTSAARSGYRAGVAKYRSSTALGVIRARSETPLRGYRARSRCH